jgi:hypothetical protein
MKTITSIKKRDPKIYDQSIKWYDEVSNDDEEKEEDDKHLEAPSSKKTFKDVFANNFLLKVKRKTMTARLLMI